MTLLSLVAVPYVPPEPPLRTAGTTLGWTLATLGLVGILGFAVITVRAILNIPFRKHEIRVAAWLSFGGLALLGACYVEWRVHHHQQDMAYRTWSAAERSASQEAEFALEQTYGIRFTSRIPLIPFEERLRPRREEVTLYDGRAETCWLNVKDQRYVVACGPDEETAVLLPPLAR